MYLAIGGRDLLGSLLGIKLVNHCYQGITSNLVPLNQSLPLESYLITSHTIQPVIGESLVERDVGEPDCGSTELSPFSIFGRLISLLYLHYGVQSRATPTGCSRPSLLCSAAAEKSLLKPRPLLLLLEIVWQKCSPHPFSSKTLNCAAHISLLQTLTL